MMNYLKELLLDCNNINIYATLRHDTSYNIYSKLCNRGYFNTIYDKIMIDISTPYYIKSIINMDNINKDYYNYILHNIKFTINDSFYNTYQKKL